MSNDIVNWMNIINLASAVATAKKVNSEEELSESLNLLDKFLLIKSNKVSLIVSRTSPVGSVAFYMKGDIDEKKLSDAFDIVGYADVFISRSVISYILELGSYDEDVSFKMFLMERKTNFVGSKEFIEILKNKDAITSVTESGGLFVVYYKNGSYMKFKVDDASAVIEYLNANYKIENLSTPGRSWRP